MVTGERKPLATKILPSYTELIVSSTCAGETDHSTEITRLCKFGFAKSAFVERLKIANISLCTLSIFKPIRENVLLANQAPSLS